MMPAGTVDDRTESVVAKCCRHVRRGASLTAVAGNQQRDVRHGGTQFGQFFGIRCPDDRTDGAKLAIRRGLVGKRLDDGGDRLIERLPLRFTILKCAGTGVAGPHEHIQPGSTFAGDVDERLQRVGPHDRD